MDSKKLADRVIAVIGVVALVVVFVYSPGAKAQSTSGNIYGSGTQLVAGQTTEGMVLQVSMKRAEATPMAQATGTGLGTLVGGLLGNSIQDPNSRMAASALGAVLGGIGGNMAAQKFSSSDAQEIVIALKDARTGSYSNVVTIVQPAPFTEVRPNQQVLLVNMGGQTRVIPKQYDNSALAQH